MAYFHNRTINLINLHYIIGSIALGGGGAFYGVWLLESGMSVPRVLLSVAGIFALRIVMRTAMLPLATRTGLRTLVIAGSLLMGIAFAALAHVHGPGWSLFWYVFSSALADTVYWPSYHAFFASLGDEEHRGQQVGLREGVVATVGIVSPLVTGWLLVTFGPFAAFYATGAVWLFAAIPILFTPDVRIARIVTGGFRAALPGILMFVGDGITGSGFYIIWQLALFVALGRNVMAYGGTLAISALVGAAGGLFLGRIIDSGKGTRAVWIAVAAMSFVILLRASVHNEPVLAVAASALGSLAVCLYVPTLMTAVYNLAKRSPCAMRFHIAAEGGWDAGVTTGLVTAAILVRLGSAVAPTILVSLVGTSLGFVLLRRYYLAHPSETVDASQTRGEEAAKV
ncbi:MAG: MFS transporter [Rhizomicrobium sp.]|jgi:hypothetical protein